MYPECALARELGLPYAPVCVSVNHAAGIGTSNEGIDFEALKDTVAEAVVSVVDIAKAFVAFEALKTPGATDNEKDIVVQRPVLRMGEPILVTASLPVRESARPNCAGLRATSGTRWSAKGAAALPRLRSASTFA